MNFFQDVPTVYTFLNISNIMNKQSSEIIFFNVVARKQELKHIVRVLLELFLYLYLKLL